MSRIKAPQPVNATEPVTDRIQSRALATFQAIVASPVLDCQFVVSRLQNTSVEQTVSVLHSLGRAPVGALIISSTVLVSSSGKQAFTQNSATINVTVPYPVTGATITVLVF